ncbi:MAG: hypothetical protein U9R25_00060 [Chloroflexota bacterium]|nr:hypothetical protein [Chloroflexota bacterium]
MSNAALELGSARHIEGTLFLFIEMAFVDRLRTGVPLLNPTGFTAFQSLFDFERLRAFQTEETIRYLDALLEDLLGMLESEQWDVALLRSREVVDATIDAYLHHLGNTDPTRKWRSVYLERLKDGSERHQRFAKTFWRLQFPDGNALRQDPIACHSHLESCVRFANEVVTWIQG